MDGDLTDPTLKTPGYKLLEQADWDYNSTVYLLNDFIAEVTFCILVRMLGFACHLWLEAMDSGSWVSYVGSQLDISQPRAPAPGDRCPSSLQRRHW